MKKIYLTILTTCLSCLLLSGCFMTDVAKDMMTDPKNSVYGAWYDESNKTYLKLNHDNTYIMGYGKYNENSGGMFTVNDKEFVLKIDYVMVDGKKQMVPATEKADMIMPYSFSLGGRMVIRTDNITLDLENIPMEGISDISQTTSPAGYWLNVAVYESLRFDASGNYTKTTENGDIIKGTYRIDGGKLIVTIDQVDLVYDIEYEHQDRFTLKIDGSTSIYERMGE